MDWINGPASLRYDLWLILGFYLVNKSYFQECIFSKTFKKCSLSCMTDEVRLNCNLNECKKTNCGDCADCDACSVEKCLVDCSTDETCATWCKFTCLQSLGTVEKSCKDFGKNFEKVTRARLRRCKEESKGSGSFSDCRMCSLVVPYYSKKCCNCSVSTKVIFILSVLYLF